MSIIEDQKHVIIVDNSKNRRVYRLDSKAGKIFHYKNAIDVSQLIGKPFNTFYQIEDSKSGLLKEITD
jgi:hypothetical protein